MLLAVTHGSQPSTRPALQPARCLLYEPLGQLVSFVGLPFQRHWMDTSPPPVLPEAQDLFLAKPPLKQAQHLRGTLLVPIESRSLVVSVADEELKVKVEKMKLLGHEPASSVQAPEMVTNESRGKVDLRQGTAGIPPDLRREGTVIDTPFPECPPHDARIG